MLTSSQACLLLVAMVIGLPLLPGFPPVSRLWPLGIMPLVPEVEQFRIGRKAGPFLPNSGAHRRFQLFFGIRLPHEPETLTMLKQMQRPFNQEQSYLD